MRIHRMKKEKKEGRMEAKKERMNESKFTFITCLKINKVVDISKLFRFFGSSFIDNNIYSAIERHYVNLILRCGVNSRLLQ